MTFLFRANLFNLAAGAPPGDLKRSMVSSDAADTFRATMPDQLGLKLDPQKAPLEILVIDRADIGMMMSNIAIRSLEAGMRTSNRSAAGVGPS